MLDKKQIEIINKSTFKELIIHNPKIIYLIKKNKIEPYWTMFIRSKLKNKEWTDEVIANCGKVCRNRMEFSRIFGFAYNLAIKKNILNEIMENKPKAEQNYTKYNYETIIQLCEENKIKTYHDFIEVLPGPHQQAYQKNITKQIKEYFNQKLLNKFKDEEKLVKFLIPTYPKLTMNPINWEIKEYFISFPDIRERIKSKIKDILIERYPKTHHSKIKKPKKIGNPKYSITYTNEQIKELAAKYYTRKEFNLKERGAYEAALRRKIIDDVCSHMEKPPESLGEQLVRRAFNYHFNTTFYKIKPEWLINPKTGMRLELDGYNEELKIAFEVNGGQHYDEKMFIGLAGIQGRDKVKVKVCKKLNIKLYVFKYENSLRNLCLKLNKEFNIPKEWLDSIVFDLCPTLKDEEIKYYRTILKLDLENPNVTDLDYPIFADYLNYLRKQNLSNMKVQQVLNVSYHHLLHRILRINQMKIELIQR